MTDEKIFRPIIESVSLRVRDLGRSSAFYGDVLGLAHTSNPLGPSSNPLAHSSNPRGREHPGDTEDGGRPDEHSAYFTAPGSEAPIVHLIEDRAARAKPRRALGLYHTALLVPDRPSLGAVLRRLKDLGIALQGASDHDVSEALYLADPDGHGLEIYRDRPPGEWSYRADGELLMTTKPLDLEGLAAASQAPAGLPPGTTIGHIHLHVSSIERSEAFYGGKLGFDVTVRSYPGALFLSARGYHHHVGLNTWAGPHAERPDDQTIGMAAFTLRPPAWPADAGDVLMDPDGIRLRQAHER